MFRSSGFAPPFIVVGIALVALGAADKKDAPATGPTKEAAIQVLNDFLTALEAKKYDKAASYIDPTSKERYEKRIPMLIEERTITRKGFDEFVAHGKYGLLKDIRPEADLDKVKERLGDSPDNVWLIRYKGSAVQAIFHWTGKEFKILGLDGIGWIPVENSKKSEDVKK